MNAAISRRTSKQQTTRFRVGSRSTRNWVVERETLQRRGDHRSVETSFGWLYLPPRFVLSELSIRTRVSILLTCVRFAVIYPRSNSLRFPEKNKTLIANLFLSFLPLQRVSTREIFRAAIHVTRETAFSKRVYSVVYFSRKILGIRRNVSFAAR